MSLTLYYHPLSSYCHKVMVALYENGVPFTPHLINLGDAADRALLQALSPMMKFPVLRDDARERTLIESSIMIEYVDLHYPGAQALLAAQPDAALEARLWDRVFDNYVQGPVQEIVADRIFQRGGDMTRLHAALLNAYRMLDGSLASRTWAAGEDFSMADCAAAPALFYATTLEPIGAEFAHLTVYFERLMARPSVQRVLEQAKPYFAMYPFAENIAPRFR